MRSSLADEQGERTKGNVAAHKWKGLSPNYLRRRVAVLSAAATLALAAHTARAGTLYVWQESPAPAAPYGTWSQAAHDIQTAVNAAKPGDTVLVTNGLYATGASYPPFSRTLTRVVVNKPLILQSVNGPRATIIQGYKMPVIINGNAAVRCVFLTNNAVLVGFTLSNGATGTSSTDTIGRYGGGACCMTTSAVLSNCVFHANSAFEGGAGVLNGTLYNCWLEGNSTLGSGGGTSGAILSNCVLANNSAHGSGGGAMSSTLYNCILNGNSARDGGGAFSGALMSCLVITNFASLAGGGTENSVLYNCTLTGNSAGDYGGGVNGSTLRNCIVVANTALWNPNYSGGSMDHCCTTPQPPSGSGNISADPGFVDAFVGNFRLAGNSLCIDVGSSVVLNANDLDGNPRVLNGTVDLGAFEFRTSDMPLIISAPQISLAGIGFEWQSVCGRTYSVERCTSRGMQPTFVSIQRNIIGLGGRTSFLDTNSPPAEQAFYRLLMQ
jgi:hypothetical protein